MNKVYCVRDRKAKIFHKPFIERDHVMAIRGFEDACKNPETPFAKWPGDFELLYLGDFDPATGRMKELEQFTVLADPLQFQVAVLTEQAQRVQ